MGSRTGTGLKSLQFLFRGITFVCALAIVIIYGYFLGTLRNRNLHIPTWVRAVEGLAGAAALYSLIGLVLLWCLAGLVWASAIAIVLDILFIGAFIYIAVSNRGGSGSCGGDNLRTPFGTGDADTTIVVNTRGSVVGIPSFRTSCQLEKAALALSIIAIGFLVFSAITELLLLRHQRREKKFGPGPNNDYTSGSGRRRGLFGKRRNKEGDADGVVGDPNALPAHAEPEQMRYSNATGSTAVGTHAAGGGIIGPDGAKLPAGSELPASTELPAGAGGGGRTYGNIVEPATYDNLPVEQPQYINPPVGNLYSNPPKTGYANTPNF